MNEINPKLTRQQSLRKGFRLAGAVLMLTLVGTGSARASKADKSDFAYQPKPKDGKRCADCRLFAGPATGKGDCAVVEGEVSADGWCMAFSAK
jgi:hypothetical protein